MGKEEEGQVKECIQKTHRQGRWDGDCLWEWGLDEARESGGEWGQL